MKQWNTLTFAQLADLTQRFIPGLQACLLSSNMRAAVMTPPSVEFFALALAMLKLGIIPVIVDPAIGLKKIRECVMESRPDIFIGNTFTHALRVLFGWGKNSIKHNLTINRLLQIPVLPKEHRDDVSKIEGTNYELPPVDLESLTPESPAAIIYTSGSTGVPKGVLYTHANFAAQLEMLKNIFDISQDEIDLPAFPLYALMDALLGVTAVIPDITFPIPKDIDPARTLSAIQEYEVTNTFASPIVLDKLAEYGVQQNIKLASLKRVITAGAPATIQLQEKFRALLNDDTDLFGIYGATEVLPIAKIESREIFEVRDKSARGAGVCLGKPVDGVQVRIIRITDDPITRWQDSLELEPNIIGEITVQGAAVTRSYNAREEANRLSKISHRNDIIHRMGDVGYFDEHGRLWYCGRKSHRVITNDDVMYTEQIENIFNTHPRVKRTALVGLNREPLLWVELEKNTWRNKDKIKDELKELARRHPQASQIKAFLFMKEFPTDVRHNSKIIREELTVLAEKRLA